MDAKLSVEVGAKIDELLGKMALAEQVVIKSVNGMDVALNKAETSFKLLNKTNFTFGANFQTASQKLATEATRTSAVLGGSFVKNTKSANAAVLELSRGIQDAPYGFTGFVNNLQQFQGLFQNLVKETGSTKEAIKALGQSIIGPAGLGVAFSLITAAITVYSLWQQKAAKNTKELADANDALAQSFAKEAASATILYDASQNLNIPLRERRKIVDELQERYPTIFGNLKDEAILAGKAKMAYDQLTQSLVNSAIARGAEDAIASKIKELGLVLIGFAEQKRKLGQQGFNLAKNNSFVVDSDGALTGLNDYEKKVKQEVDDVRQSIQGLLGQFSAEEIIGKIGGESNRAIGKTRDELLKELQEAKDALNLTLAQARSSTFNQGFEVFRDRMKESAKKVFKSGEPLIPIENLFNLSGLPEYVSKQLDLINYELNDFNDRASEIVNNGIYNTFGGIGDAIASALSGSENAITALSMSLLGSLGRIVSDLGELAIATGVGIKAIKVALKSLNPVVAIGAGIALVALGKAITSSVSKLGSDKMPGFATGVNNFRGGLALVGEKGPEIVNLPQGADVIPNHRTKGMFGGGDGFIAETRIDLDAIWIGLKRIMDKRASLG